MIFDRTQNDVNQAKKIIANKIRLNVNGNPTTDEPLTDDEIMALSRGTFNVEDINRIEDKMGAINRILAGMGYYHTDVILQYPAFALGDTFDEDDFRRWINNLNMLINAFYTYSSTPQVPPISYHYRDINAIEKILYDLEAMTNDVKAKYRRCGTFRCGEVI